MPLFQKDRKHVILLAGLVLAHFILISLQVPLGGRVSFFEKAVFSLMSPFGRAASSISRFFSESWNDYFYLRRVRSQNLKMRDELFNLRQENNLLRNLTEKMRGELGIRAEISRYFRSFAVASVTGLDVSNVNRSIIINRGRGDGLKPGMVVLDPAGQVVGRTTGPVAEHSSRVQLITDEQSGTSVFTMESKAIGILKGDGQGRCRLEYILSTNPDVAEEEEVLTSGFDDVFPSGLKVGRIVSILESTSLFKRVLVRPYFRLSELRQVAVLTEDLKEF